MKLGVSDKRAADTANATTSDFTRGKNDSARLSGWDRV